MSQNKFFATIGLFIKNGNVTIDPVEANLK